MLVYPDLLLTTGDDVCYGGLVFKCVDNERVRLTMYVFLKPGVSTSWTKTISRK